MLGKAKSMIQETMHPIRHQCGCRQLWQGTWASGSEEGSWCGQMSVLSEGNQAEASPKSTFSVQSETLKCEVAYSTLEEQP